MKPARIAFYVILLAIVLLSVFVLVKHLEKNGQPIAMSTLTEIISDSAINPTPINSDLTGKIISDMTTASNRVVVAEKDGVQKTAYIPPSLAHAMTDDQIIESLFHTNSLPVPSTGTLNQHLSFYGLTVDDKTNVLGGVTISGGVLVVDGKNPSQRIPINTVSGADGRFQVDVDYGQLIWLTVSKGTNYISPPSRQFQYGTGGYGARDSETISHPNVNDPRVFVLTKKQETEPLIEIRKGMTAPNTGEPVRIDLTTGQVVATGGDLIVSITCLDRFKAGVHIPWKLVLQATDGGLATISEGQLDRTLMYQFEAPPTGYDEVVIDHPKDDPKWDTQYDGILYLKSRNGQIYGKLSFGMNIIWDERGVAFGFHSFVNTNGSRNLQGNPQ
jgi:hypothetical protein